VLAALFVRLPLLNRIQRKMAAQSSVVSTATLAILACRRLERSRRVVRCRHLCGDREEAASSARSPALLGVIAVAVAPVVEELLFRGALLTGLLYILGALHIRSDVNVAPQHLVRCPGIWLRSPGPFRDTIAGNRSDGHGDGWLRVRSASTAIAAAAHSAYNLVLQFFPP
jgi:hypothetical protein